MAEPPSIWVASMGLFGVFKNSVSHKEDVQDRAVTLLMGGPNSRGL